MYRILIILITAAAITPARAQWTEPVRISEPGGCWYPQILAQGDTLHVVYENTDQFDKISYLRSDDRGESWTDRSILSEDSSQTVFPRLLHNGTRLMALWRNIAYYQEPGNWNIGYAISDNNGLTWTEPSYMLNPGWNHILYFSASGSGPVVNVMLSSRIDHDLVFFNVKSTNFGQSWSDPVELFRAAQSSMTDQVSCHNMVHYVWSGRFVWEGVYETFWVRSLDNGESWSYNDMLSSDDSILSRTPSILANGADTVGVSWTDWKYSPYWWTGDIFYSQSSDSGNSWQAESEITVDHLADYSDVCADGEAIHAVWEDYSSGITRRNVYYECSNDGGESWTEHHWLDGTDDDSWNPAVAASNGTVYVVWADGRDDPGIGLYFSRYEDETGISDEGPTMPIITALRAYPNPFNSNVNVSLIMEKGGKAEIGIYDVGGRLVKTIFKGGRLDNGAHKFTWDATDANGKAVSSGLYFAVASTPQGKINKTLTLIR